MPLKKRSNAIQGRTRFKFFISHKMLVAPKIAYSIMKLKLITSNILRNI